VGQDLASLKNLSNAFYFSQECETPQRLAEISDQIMAQGLDIKYQVFARLDKRFSREIFVKLQRSGCQYVFFGLESGSQRVNNIINKGVDLRQAKRILADCHAAGQNVVVSSIKGFPTERPEEFKSTQDFYQTLYKNYGQDIRIAGSSHFFRLARDSRVDKKPEHFGLDHVWRSNAGELAMNYPSYRLAPEHRNGELSQSLREYHAQLPHIVFNEHVVLIINAINGSRAQALRTTGPRPQTPAKTALDAGQIESGRFLLSEQSVLLDCAFNLVDLQKRSNSRRPLAEVQFYDQGRPPGEILARMEKDEPPLEKHEILLAANPARGKARALNARLACLLRACVHPRSFSQLLEDMPGLGLPAQAEGLAKLLSGLVQTGVLKLC
jgi:hypothetical protein